MEQDKRVVSHNPEMLLNWDAHLNVEYSATVERLLYLFKYLYKGVKAVRLKISKEKQEDDGNNNNDNNNHDNDNEITKYLHGKVLCSMDAVSRILGFHTYPSPNPSVKVIKPKLESQVKYLKYRLNKECDIYIYFNRPNQLNHLKFCDFFNDYTITKKMPVR